MTVLKSVSTLVVVATLVVSASWSSNDNFKLKDDTPVWEVYEKLGKIKLHAVNPKVAGASAEIGKDIVLKGSSVKRDGKKGKTAKQSKHFECTACHTIEKEFHDLSDLDPNKKLAYAAKNNIPFLQGSSFYGIVNREHFYNDEYQKKYKDVPGIKKSFSDVRAAIQVCAIQCSQGRALEDWEIESVLMYFWTLQLKIGDLNLTDEQKQKIEYALNERQSGARAFHYIRDEFSDVSPAHFAKPMEYRKLSDTELKNKERFQRGKWIYDLGCKHCHGKKRYSFYNLDDNTSTFKHLAKHMERGKHHSIHKISRYGTAPKNFKKAYMPQYTTEKMSDSQLMDLQIYVANMAKGNNLLK
ncbi:MAG: cytochrome c [Aureispira sp.]|nr:cytochrome c [Aureispira sp.]